MPAPVRTHRPVMNRVLCDQCVLCLGACPGNFLSGLRFCGVEGKGAAAPRLPSPPPCVLACPLNQQVRDYIRLLGRGQAGRPCSSSAGTIPCPASAAISATTLPACLHTRGNGAAVAIRDLKRGAIEYEMGHRDEIRGCCWSERGGAWAGPFP